MRTIQKLWLAVTVLVSTVVTAQTQTENYVQTTAYQKAVQEGQEDQVLESDKIISVNYFDGLGRAKQSVAVNAGGQQQSTNILDWTNDWSVGTGSTPLFNKNGQASENERLFGENPFGAQSMLWKCGNDPESNADGGWNVDYIAVDKNISYRYTVWVKRTGSQNGTTYHGTSTVNNLSGSQNNNPYFFYGDLPQLDTWYLLVGVVHPHTYTGGNSGISGVYDLNGTKVMSGTDFKWRDTTVTSRFRSYLFSATDPNVRQYFWNPVLTQIDGTGTPITELIQQSTPKDIITHYEYDDYGRQAKEYLPYASDQTQNGAIYTDPLAELNAFYNSAKYQQTTNPYSETVFEQSPLQRPLKQGAPGLDWKIKSDNTDHTIKMDRQTNSLADGVVYLKVSFTNGNTEAPTLVTEGSYAANDLYVNITKDENWKSSDGDNHTTEEYTDKLGRVILKRTFNEQEPHDTYYIYDDFGNLTYVLSPKVDLTNGVSGTELNELCYQYKYDNRNRLVEKKIPGKGWEYIVYNTLDQPVLTQDANQRVNNEWLFTKYDAFGRVAYTGLHLHPGLISRTQMQGYADNTATYTQYVTKTSGSTNLAGTDVYYTNDAIPTGINKIYTINYYDDYEVGNVVSFNPANGSGTWEGMTSVANVKGLPTVTQVRVLGTNDWITTAMYYEEKGRIWSTHVKNDYLATEDWSLNKLDFTGRVLISQNMHTKAGTTITTKDTFTYDHMGRLLTQKQQINSEPEEMIVHNVYDDLGQLERKKVGNAEQAPLQTVDYKYNVRGWLTDINDVNNIGDDLFSFKINYNKSELNDFAKLYNGNIKEVVWKTANDDEMNSRMYGYQYDHLNRLTGAAYYKGFVGILYFGQFKYGSGYSYDKNGNIQSLSRGSDQDFVLIDRLTYEYDAGNKLLKVTDTEDPTQGFIDGNTIGNDYEYDVNGNMIIDRNKSITGITYNYLNLPETVTINDQPRSINGNISYIYDATGAKLKKIVTEGSSLTETVYAGNYIYKNGALEFMNHPEGYIQPKNDGSFDYVYQLKDHLGNIRLSYADIDEDGRIDVLRNNTDVDGDGDLTHEILQEKNYYPFGLQHKGYNNTITGRNHNYSYLGQEEQNELGLNWLTFRYRNYMPEIGRFFGVDPVSEEYMSISTYQFAHNSPIWKVELEGLEGEPINEKDVITHEPIKVQQARGPGPIGPMVATGKVVQEATKEVAKQSSTLKNVIKLGGTAIATVLAVLTDTMSPNTGGETCDICLHRGKEYHENLMNSILEETAVDEKFKVDDKIVKTEGESDSPIKRMGDFEEEKVNEKSSGKNGKHSNKKAKESALDKYNNFKNEFESLKSKPNKTKQDKKMMEKARKQMNHWKGKADFSGENHSQRNKT
ncbi:DUF6443 domain-containing protein [Aquimarina sp. 2201CG14-23]|uniref:DUF6443 domain-containing protein n=1 Tax=Aquimarina mycalae TaxID=3040073 RepID=UPI002477F3B5|nr:DUF6443 domain-containing protein [Aquimarina sp. 2201CG14-23]MDH7447322.1 DUF6443 domain-containing protein [Aquimarina sp. 2201CG14-23]